MEVGGPPWLESAAVRAGYATVSATTAVAIAWAVARSGQPLLHAVAWPLYGLMLVTVGRTVWRDTHQAEGTTVAVAVETMMIVIGVAAAVMAATGALGSPVSAPETPTGTTAPAVLDVRTAPTSTVPLLPVDTTTTTAVAAVVSAPTTTVAGSTTTTTAAPVPVTDAVPAVVPGTTVAGSVRVTTTARPPVIGTPTTIRRPVTTTTRPATTVATTAATTVATTAPPTTPATTTPPTTLAPTTVAPTTAPPTTVSPTTTAAPG